MKIAIVHDWLITPGGAEKVLREILFLLQDFEVDIFCLADHLDKQDRNAFIQGKETRTSFIQNLPRSKAYYRYYLPLFPRAVKGFDLQGYDLIISSSHSVAKNVTTNGIPHICYCHTPMRYVWDMQDEYMTHHGMNSGLKKSLISPVLRRLRQWDYIQSEQVSCFISNSDFIRKRIENSYNREAHVIYPPVDTDFYNLYPEKENFFVTASRMVPYKRVELIVEAFNYLPSYKLVVIGDGPEFNRIQLLAGKNIEIIKYDTPEVLRYYLQRAKAFLFAAIEDFGITPVEAQSCGTPVIAFGKGGAKETIIEGVTGFFYPEQSVKSIIDAIYKFENRDFAFSPEVCRQNALRFQKQNFRSEFYHIFYQQFLKHWEGSRNSFEIGV